jgi:hypothetical protein
VFPMSLSDLARAHQEDLSRRTAREAVTRRGRLVRQTGELSDWLAAAWSDGLRRSQPEPRPRVRSPRPVAGPACNQGLAESAR